MKKDQNTFVSKIWGTLTFVPTGSNSKWNDTCRKCPLWIERQRQTEMDECLRAPCTPSERTDGKHGFFSLHQMP